MLTPERRLDFGTRGQDGRNGDAVVDVDSAVADDIEEELGFVGETVLVEWCDLVASGVVDTSCSSVVCLTGFVCLLIGL